MGNYCTAINNTNQAVLDYLRNKTFEINHQKAFGEEPLEWRFDAIWKKRLTAPKVLKDKFTFEDMTDFVSSFPEMRKNKNQKIIKDCKKWPYTCCGIVKSKFKIDADSVFNKISENSKTSEKTFIDLESYLKSRTKEIIGAGYLIGNSVVLTLVKNIYLQQSKNANANLNVNLNNKQGEKKIKEIKASEVKFYAYFNGNTGIECEVDAIHHLDFEESFQEIYEDFALLFLKKPIGDELGFLGVWDKLDFIPASAQEGMSADVLGYLYDDIYENKIYLNELKIQVNFEKNDAYYYKEYNENSDELNKNKNKRRKEITTSSNKNTTEALLDNENKKGENDKEEKVNNKFYKSFTNLKQTSKTNHESSPKKCDYNVSGKSINPTEENESTSNENSSKNQMINNTQNQPNVNFYPEFFTFQAEQQFNLLPGAAVWASKQPNKHFILGLYLGKNPTSNQHFGRFLPQSIPNFKEWILDYWFENKKENTRILMASGDDFKVHKADALHLIVNKYTKLTSLSLGENAVTDDEVLLLVKNLNSLKSLKLRNNSLTTNTAIYIANNQRSIEELDLSGNNIGYVGVKEIAAKLRKIKILLLERTGLKDNSLTDIADNLIDLSVLDVSRNFISDEGVFSVSAENVNLTELNLSGNESVSDEALAYISENSLRLQTLLVAETNVSDTGLAALGSRAPYIQKLSLAKCAAVSDVGLNSVISGFKYLHSLNISQCYGVSDEFKRSLVKTKIIKNLIV